MKVSIVELSNDSWSVVITFGKYTTTKISNGYPNQSEIQKIMDDMRNKARRDV